MRGMCGRFALDEKTNDLITQFVVEGNDFENWEPRYSIAPKDVTPIIREHVSKDTGKVTRTIEPAEFDFRPAWRTDSRPQHNARLDRLASNGLWKAGFASRRCIVPMTGYFEWTGPAGKKDAHFLHADSTLAAAGICAVRKVTGKDGTDRWAVSMAVVTGEGRDASGEIHDRMPVFLSADLYGTWLSPAELDLTDTIGIKKLLEEVDAASATIAATITSYQVDRKVNTVQTVDPYDASIIAPID